MCTRVHVYMNVLEGEKTRPVWRGRKNPSHSQAVETRRISSWHESPGTPCPPFRPETEAGRAERMASLSWRPGWDPEPSSRAVFPWSKLEKAPRWQGKTERVGLLGSWVCSPRL